MNLLTHGDCCVCCLQSDQVCSSLREDRAKATAQGRPASDLDFEFYSLWRLFFHRNFEDSVAPDAVLDRLPRHSRDKLQSVISCIQQRKNIISTLLTISLQIGKQHMQYSPIYY